MRAERLIDALEEFPRDFFWLSAVAVLAECAALLGDAPRAQRLYASLAPYAGRFVQVSFAACLGSLERYLGLLAQTTGHTAEAEDHLRRALAANQSLGSPVLTAVTQVDYAALLLGRGGDGDRARAAELGAAAQQVGESLGLAALVRDATRVQRAR